MVKLTVDLIARGTSGYTKKKRDETMQQYLKRLTHLYLEDKGIDEVGDDLSLCHNLSVLYLYDNELAQIPRLNQNQNITMLYLQNNHISKVENLSPLFKLTKLYIGGNQLTVIEGLEKLQHLKELHVENQKLPPGEKLLFDPRSLKAISGSLQVLNVSGNNLDSLQDLECLRNLVQLMASDNELNDMKELAHVLGQWPFLQKLELMGNPLCHKAKYKDRVIIMASNLDSLDGRGISDTAKQFLRNWHANKETQKKRKDDLFRRGTLAEFGSSGSHELPPVRESGRVSNSATIPGYMMPENIMKGLPRKQFDDILARNATMENSTGQRSAPIKSRSGVLRSNYLESMGDILEHGTMSASLRRRPVMSVTFELAGNLNQTRHISATDIMN